MLYYRKNFYLLTLILSFILLPQICRADLAVGAVVYNLPLLGLVSFMGVWIIETVTIEKRLKKNAKDALFSALVINLITAFLGFGAVWKFVIPDSLVDKLFSNLGLTTLALFFLGSVLVEALFLYYFYRNKDFSEIAKTSFCMNAKSYLFILALIILDIAAISLVIILALVPYFFLKFFKIITAGTSFSLEKRKWLKILILLLSIGIAFLTVVAFLNSRPPKMRYVKDARITSEMGQLRAEAELIVSEKGGYSSLDEYCFSGSGDPELDALCSDIAKQCESGETCKELRAKGIEIHANKDSYCAYSGLNVEENYYCVDSNGVATTVVSTNCSKGDYSCK